ncbi:hypothetical protein ACJX0J_040634, partial [Zea mays]
FTEIIQQAETVFLIFQGLEILVRRKKQHARNNFFSIHIKKWQMNDKKENNGKRYFPSLIKIIWSHVCMQASSTHVEFMAQYPSISFALVVSRYELIGTKLAPRPKLG